MTKQLSTRDFVDLIIGKNLTTHKIMSLIKKHHPDRVPTPDNLRRRLDRMCKSTHATVLISHDRGVKKFKLTGVDDRFFRHSESASAVIAAKRNRAETEQYRSPHSAAELRFCHMHKMFDLALASMRNRGGF